MINSVGSYYRPVAYQIQQQPQTQPNFTGKEENKKEGMSKTSKTLLGLGALAAVGIGGLLLKKRIDIKALEKSGAFIRGEEGFSTSHMLEYIDRLSEKGVFDAAKKYEASGMLLDKEGIKRLGIKIPEALSGKHVVLVSVNESGGSIINSRYFIADNIADDLAPVILDKKKRVVIPLLT